MNPRQESVLLHIIEGYLKTAEPIGSHYLAVHSKLAVSPATIRNEMAQLENDGLIYQPHTSAGRIPTTEGLLYYVAHMLKPEPLTTAIERKLDAAFNENGLKGVAKECAALSRSACFIAKGDNDFYYTGFSQLFDQPEFINAALVCAIGHAIDSIESALPGFIQNHVTPEPAVYVGDANPLGPDCSLTIISNQTSKPSAVGLISSLRTNYRINTGLLAKVSTYL